ncbi:hypothetical protein SELMODRAFT_403203 [Selaginella moellendorffii]|uniref:J domain-containing protein n=1 Tax=Selaginella moellendorffii TaxID=88036 RepID=D8QTE6_SELML|nr:dnaJ homolog subfamily C member 17 [Selaginella moellendorffii]EFJ36635.1 hypothetical protein SELMODRAFT_403203 [Selaginella moellendorffii]|eukprot:XP_002961375.1 dnaJ homolog subfamily C member 17 [Selaginella moellendorffii]
MEGTEDLYALLGLPGGVDGAAIQVTELKKAWRRRCLEWHPDKRPGDATAAAQFNRINNAFEVLSDAKARKAYDELQLLRRRREEEKKEMSAKRQKMVDDLQKREAAFELQRREKAAEVSAAQRLKEEIARIRVKKSQKTMGRNGIEPGKPVDIIVSEEDKDKALKVTWDLAGTPGYDVESLRGIFQRFGPVEDVLRLEKKKKGVALVVMVTAQSALEASQSQCGHIANPLLVIPLGNPFRQEGAENPRDTKTPAAARAPSPSPAANHATLAGSGFGDREDLVLRKLKEAQERKRKMDAAAKEG